MNEAEKIRRSIQAMMGKKESSNHTAWGTVKSVSGKTCTVTIDECDNENILLGFDLSGVIVYPKVNKDVLILFSDEKKINGVVIYCEETEKIEIMGNAKGGLVIVSDLTQQLNKLEQDLNNLKTVFTTWAPVTYDGGAALKTAASAWAGQTLMQTVDSDIENNKIKHGQG